MNMRKNVKSCKKLLKNRMIKFKNIKFKQKPQKLIKI